MYLHYEGYSTDKNGKKKTLRTMRPIYRTGVPLPTRCCILYSFFNYYKYWEF